MYKNISLRGTVKHNTHYYIAFLTLVSLFLVACGRQSQQIDATGIEMSLSVASTEVGETDLEVLIVDGEGNPINDAELEIKGDMSHAGMEPVLADTSAATDGVYTVPFEWTMGGDWFVTVEATFADGTVISRRFDGISIGGDMSDMDMDGEEGDGDSHDHDSHDHEEDGHSDEEHADHDEEHTDHDEEHSGHGDSDS